MVNGEAIVMAVTAVVAVGTALYYLFFDDKNKPHSHNQNPGNRPRPPSPPYRPPSPPPSMKGKNKPHLTRKSKTDSENKKDIGKAPNENSIKSASLHECKVCDKIANMIFLPCEHKVFCVTHMHQYLNFAKEYRNQALCPVEECRKMILGHKEDL